MRVIWLVLLVVLGCKQAEELSNGVGKMSDAAATASAAIREERRTSAELTVAINAVADNKDLSQIETKILPALERYVSALDAAIPKLREMATIDPDPKTAALIDVYQRRSAIYGKARDQLAALRGKPDEMGRALLEIGTQLMAAP